MNYGLVIAGTATLDRSRLLIVAWAEARSWARQFGGSARAYLAEGLRFAWNRAREAIANARWRLGLVEAIVVLPTPGEYADTFEQWGLDQED